MLALTEFGFGDVGIAAEDFTSPGRVVQLGFPPARIDLLTSLTGVSWEQAAAGRALGAYDDCPVSFLGRTELIANKKAVGRAKDVADIESLGGSGTS